MLLIMKGRIEIIEFESECLKGNPLGDPSIRELCVYLPPSYDENDTRFPTVYCLTGFTGRGKMLLNDNAFSPNIAQRMDSLIAAKAIKPMIVVMPDCFTKFGGSQYINSTATGNYEDYLTAEILQFVDQKYRTIADKNSRAVMGKSSGGYGALICGIRHADKFGLISSISGDAYFEFCYLSDFPKAFRGIRGNPAKFIERFLGSEKQNKGDFPALNILGMSSCYSPNGSDFDLPFDLETGEIREDIWAKWLAHDPVRLVEKSVENLKSLRLLHLDAGTRDEFALDLGARILSKKLTSLGISHVHDEFDDGHFNISYRYNRSLELFSKHFDSSLITD
jgi:S-formylglutathione hydrolase FrmB